MSGTYDFDDKVLGKRVRLAIGRLRFVGRHLIKNPGDEALQYSYHIELRSFEHLLQTIENIRPEVAGKIKTNIERKSNSV